MNDYAFGNHLYELRMKKGLTQKELGALLGVSGKAVSKWETGASKPRTDMLMRLAAIYGLSVGELLSRGSSVEMIPSQETTDEKRQEPLPRDHALALFLATSMIKERDRTRYLSSLFSGLVCVAMNGFCVLCLIVKYFSLSLKVILPWGITFF